MDNTIFIENCQCHVVNATNAFEAYSIEPDSSFHPRTSSGFILNVLAGGGEAHGTISAFGVSLSILFPLQYKHLHDYR